MSTERVSRWFAMGFRVGTDGGPESALPFGSCRNEWERADLICGHAEGARGLAHIQFWLVQGPFRHEEVERQIAAERKSESLTTEDTENTEGKKL